MKKKFLDFNKTQTSWFYVFQETYLDKQFIRTSDYYQYNVTQTGYRSKQKNLFLWPAGHRVHSQGIVPLLYWYRPLSELT